MACGRVLREHGPALWADAALELCAPGLLRRRLLRRVLQRDVDVAAAEVGDLAVLREFGLLGAGDDLAAERHAARDFVAGTLAHPCLRAIAAAA